jgi:hypothetical protein
MTESKRTRLERLLGELYDALSAANREEFIAKGLEISALAGVDIREPPPSNPLVPELRPLPAYVPQVQPTAESIALARTRIAEARARRGFIPAGLENELIIAEAALEGKLREERLKGRRTP